MVSRFWPRCTTINIKIRSINNESYTLLRIRHYEGTDRTALCGKKNLFPRQIIGFDETEI